MRLALLVQLSDRSVPDTRFLFLVNLLTVLAVATFAIGVIVVLLRYSYRRRLEEQKMAAMGTATARILHQIKNPVQSVLLQAELLEEFERVGSDELRREAAAAILSEAHRLSAMLHELTLWASGARRALALTPTALHVFIAEIARREKRENERRGIQLEAPPPAEAYARIDGYYLRQAIENLLRNAVEALRGRPGAQLRLELERVGPHAALRVIDNGPGIPAHRQQQVFEPFVSGGAGMGLGLTIAKEIVEAHGGQLNVESTPGAGTVFTVLLPLESGEAAAQPPAVAESGA